MNEPERIADQLRRAHEGDAWHGPSLREILAGVSAEQASARPIPGAHSIWEIVLHLAADEDLVLRRLAGEVILELPPEEDWPQVADPSEAAWEQAKGRLDAAHRRLNEAIVRLAPSRLDDPVPGKGYSVYVMLHGVVQHDLYHAGQVALLKRLLTNGA